MKRWSVLRVTTEEFVVEANTKEGACNKVSKMKLFIPTVDIDAEEVGQSVELSFPVEG